MKKKVEFLNSLNKFRLSDAMATNPVERFGQNDTLGSGLFKEHFCKSFVMIFSNESTSAMKITIAMKVIEQWQ